MTQIAYHQIERSILLRRVKLAQGINFEVSVYKEPLKYSTSYLN